MQPKTFARLVPLAALLLALAGCGSDEPSGSSGGGAQGFTPPKVPMLQSLGAGEGSVNLVAWAGYVEDGSTDPKVDWVTPFEKATGCKVNVKVAAGDVAPVNTDLVKNYADVFDALKLQPWNSVKGVAYGIPHGRGANLLMWRTDHVKPAPNSWGVVFDPNSPYKGKVTAYDSPIYIADAAVYLKATKPDLGITNPYELDDKQFQASVDLLKQQATVVGEYWSDYTKEIQAFKAGSSVVGTTWQIIANLAQADKAPVQVTLPKEGSTGWSDTWMVSSKAAHPNCAYMWMDHIVSPKANAAVAEWFGEAPANRLACDQTADKSHCDTFHATDEAYFSKVAYWTTPIKDCGDARGQVCKDYSEWTRAWTEIKG
jgi:putative spermidine/putrescine transport system substrate-binding protein